MKRCIRTSLCTIALVFLACSSALAGLGLQAGLSLDPDDFIAGLNWTLDPLAKGLYLVPSVEVGFGDITMLAGNLDLHYRFQTNSKLAPYAGGGVTVNYFDFDGGSDTEVGGSILGGLLITPQIGLEGKVGLGDVPDFKFLAKFNLK